MSLPVIPLLLSGGRGTRLWPLSRSRRPKQLQPLLGAATMLQATATRMDGVEGVTSPILVCGADHAEVAIAQLREIAREPGLVITEPVGRNTAPAITAAALAAPSDSILAVLPADHIVTDLAAFRTAMSQAVHAADDGRLVTFGVVPTRPETGYGYIESSEDGPVRPIVRFVEKPDLATAESFVGDGHHFWNSGMFVFRPDVVLEEIRRHSPGMIEVVGRALADETPPMMTAGRDFAHASPVAFDVAVMERTERGVMVPLDAGWSDVGSWRSLWDVSDRDQDGNVVVGDGVLDSMTNSYVRSDGRPVVAMGLDGVVVIDTGDVVFVAAMDRAQDVRDLVQRIDRERPDLG